jgi:hypothetical protein
MTPRKRDADVNIVYQEDGFRSRTGHWVRTSEEAIVCSWLEKRDVLHRHAGEVFRLSIGAAVGQRVYIPSIILDLPGKRGKTVIIEPLDGFGLTQGKMKMLAEFRAKHKRTHFVVALVKRQSLRKVPRDARDALIALEDIKSLEQIISFEDQ